MGPLPYQLNSRKNEVLVDILPQEPPPLRIHTNFKQFSCNTPNPNPNLNPDPNCRVTQPISSQTILRQQIAKKSFDADSRHNGIALFRRTMLSQTCLVCLHLQKLRSTRVKVLSLKWVTASATFDIRLIRFIDILVNHKYNMRQNLFSLTLYKN